MIIACPKRKDNDFTTRFARDTESTEKGSLLLELGDGNSSKERLWPVEYP
jgi:hypothetical protein